MSCGCSTCEENNETRKDYQYAVKIVCGPIDGDVKNAPLPVGQYFTKVNIHNFSRCDCTTFRWKVAVGNPRLQAGPITSFFDANLCADEALEITNMDIFRALEKSGIKNGAHVEGWVVIESPEELDVVAVYATGSEDKRKATAFHTERVNARCLTVCEDFYADVGSGVAPWEFRGPGSSPDDFRWATLSAPHAAWHAALPDTVWVVPDTMDSQAGDYIYRLPFKLCSGFENPNLNIQVLADNSSTVFLNGTAIPASGPNGSFTTPTSYASTTGFKVGQNELTIIVNNKGGPTGLNVSGSIEVERGLCAGDSAPRLPCPEICYEVFMRHFIWQANGGFWSPTACNGNEAGTTGQHRRIEAFRARLSGPVVPGTKITYRGHLEKKNPFDTGGGWTDWIDEGSDCGSTGEHRRMEAIEVKFVLAPPCCSVSYQVHMKKGALSGGGGWGPPEHDGATAGTVGKLRRIEAIKMKIDCV